MLRITWFPKRCLYLSLKFSLKIRKTKNSDSILCLQVATLGLPGAALAAPALPPVLPPAQGDKPRHGDLLSGRHRARLPVSGQQQQHNRSQRGEPTAAESQQQFSFLPLRQPQETPGIVRMTINNPPRCLIFSHIKNGSRIRKNSSWFAKNQESRELENELKIRF